MNQGASWPFSLKFIERHRIAFGYLDPSDPSMRGVFKFEGHVGEQDLGWWSRTPVVVSRAPPGVGIELSVQWRCRIQTPTNFVEKK